MPGGRPSTRADSPLTAPPPPPPVLVPCRSYGSGCAQPGRVGVYTRISAFTTWIASIVPSVRSTVAAVPPPPVAVNPQFLPVPGGSVCAQAWSNGTRPTSPALVDCGAFTIASIRTVFYGNPTGAALLFSVALSKRGRKNVNMPCPDTCAHSDPNLFPRLRSLCHAQGRAGPLRGAPATPQTPRRLSITTASGAACASSCAPRARMNPRIPLPLPVASRTTWTQETHVCPAPPSPVPSPSFLPPSLPHSRRRPSTPRAAPPRPSASSSRRSARTVALPRPRRQGQPRRRRQRVRSRGRTLQTVATHSGRLPVLVQRWRPWS